MCDAMTFPDTAEEFMEQYKIVDTEHVYTNGAELIPIFRMKQWLEHLQDIEPERKTGTWIPQDHNRRNGYVTTTVYYYPKCSECGHSGSYGMNYCPSCGAYMGGEQDE